jgi:hypothetical protein
MDSSDAFYEPCGSGEFRPTRHTEGPWSSEYQHGGPPAALLTRQIEECVQGEDLIIARLTFDILKPIPVVPLRVHARPVRSGWRVQLVEATLAQGDRVVMNASAWAVRVVPQQVPAPHEAGSPKPPTIPPTEWVPAHVPEWDCGFLAATEWRFVRGGYTTPGPATVWTRTRYPLLAGEPMSPVQRVVLTADSTNGVSSMLDIRSWSFIPPELTVHCLRAPRGEWLCLDTATVLNPGAAGLASSRLYDEDGLVAVAAQSLLVSALASSRG